MKKIRFASMLLLCCALLAGCAGSEGEEGTWRGVQAGMENLAEITERTEYYDIVSESEDIFHFGMGEESPRRALKETGTARFLLGMQFYKGEPVQLWAEADPEVSDVFLYRADGSRELLLQGVPTDYTLFGSYGWNWHISHEGDFYCWHRANYSIYHPETVDDDIKAEAAFAKLSPSGEIIFEETFAPGIFAGGFCQLSDGRCGLLLENETEQTRTLAVLGSAAESLSESDRIQMRGLLWGEQILGTASESLAVFNYAAGTGMEIAELNPADGKESCLLSFTGTSYAMDHAMNRMQDFRMLEDGSVEILWLESADRAEGTLERLRMVKMDKIPIVLRGDFKSDGWTMDIVSAFNRQSGQYHVIIEDCGRGNDKEEFARLTSIQLAAGKGPDIIQAELMQDYIAGMLEKGALEDLSPYMEKSGVREDDYFPSVFSTWRNGGRIYGINPRLSIVGYKMNADILKGDGEPDIEGLADALLSWEGNAVYMSGKDSRDVLKMFLEGTDTLWGMVDWERGSCDFDGGLFAKILEASKRYGDNGRKGQLPGIAEQRAFWDIFMFDSAEEQEGEGKVTCGVLFDDGCHGAVYSGWTMAVNSNSPNKEGAWEFLRFLLGEEAQLQKTLMPVSRNGFELWLEKQRAQAADGKTVSRTWVIDAQTRYEMTYTEEDLTEEKIAEYRKELEEAKPYPIRTAPILAIILDESENYFNGSRSAAQVSKVVTNRVQLYLDEIR